MLKQRIREARQADDGFTLIELLIVIVVLGVLAGIVVFGVTKFRTDSADGACNAEMKTVQIAAEAYHAKNIDYPADMTAMVPAYVKAHTSGDYSVVYTRNAAGPNGTFTITGALANGGPACTASPLNS